MLITLTKKQFEGIVRQAFRKGECWGITHSTWFTPTKEQIKLKQDEAIKRGYEIAEDKQ